MTKYPPYVGWDRILAEYRNNIVWVFDAYQNGQEDSIRKSLDNIQEMTDWIRNLLDQEDKRQKRPWWKRWALPLG